MTMVGVAVGDAFGAGIELQDADWIREHIDFTQWVNKRGPCYTFNRRRCLYKTFNPLSSRYTGDTEMTVGLLKALSQPKGTRGLGKNEMLWWWKRECGLARSFSVATRLWGLVRRARFQTDFCTRTRGAVVGIHDVALKPSTISQQHYNNMPLLFTVATINSASSLKVGVGRNGRASMQCDYDSINSIDDVLAVQAAHAHPDKASPVRALPLGYLRSAVVRFWSLFR
jgi:hypothetical protein